MTYWDPIALGLFILLVALLPALFLVFAALVISNKRHAPPARLLVIGAILLAMASLDSTFSYFAAYLLDAQRLADIIVYSSFIFEGLNMAALILIGSGLIKLSNMTSPENASNQPL